MNIDGRIQTLIKMQAERNEVFNNWLKYLITTVVTLMGILIALKKNEAGSLASRMFFAGALVLFLIGVLTGSYLLYSDILLRDSLAQSYRDDLQVHMQTGVEGNRLFVSKTPLFYKAAQITCYCCLALGLVLLVCFAIIADIHL